MKIGAKELGEAARFRGQQLQVPAASSCSIARGSGRVWSNLLVMRSLFKAAFGRAGKISVDYKEQICV
jgi:hypothetical protein